MIFLPKSGCVRIVVAALVAAVATPAWAYTPNSPKVRQMLDKSIKYLEGAQGGDSNAAQLGGECLMALAIHKYYKAYDSRKYSEVQRHPKVQKALDRVRADAVSASRIRSDSNYSVGIALIFLFEVAQDSPEIELLYKELARRQQEGGGWGYENTKTGDTSQTQYAVLGSWSAYKAGIDVPYESMEKVLNWLIRTQDPTGAWGYQGKDPGDFTRVAQDGKSASLAAAGLGSVYVCGDFLGFSKGNRRPAKSVKGLPPALIPVLEVNEETRKRRDTEVMTVDPDKMRAAMNDGDNWFERNFELRATDWFYYYIYALERYHAFREFHTGRFEEEPGWYNAGVDFLAKNQSNSGAWDPGFGANGGVQVDTAFASLFLLRSTAETIERVTHSDGLLVGGQGLPKDLAHARLDRENRIVVPAIKVQTDQLMEMLDSEEGEKIEALLDNPDALSVSEMKGAGREFTSRLKRIVRSGSYQARIVAVRALGRQGDLDNVPILLYALTDPDPRVMTAARDALRLTSRKFEGFGLPDDADAAQVAAAVEKWKQWYKSVRPDAAFIDN